jgi:hypothetical protein
MLHCTNHMMVFGMPVVSTGTEDICIFRSLGTVTLIE